MITKIKINTHSDIMDFHTERMKRYLGQTIKPKKESVIAIKNILNF